MSNNLKNKAVNSIVWTTIRTICVTITGPILLFIQARFLSTAEMGILAIINIVYGLLVVLENFGFSQAVIQRDEVTLEERSSLFIFELLFCGTIGIILILASGIVADIFDMNPLRELLALMSLIVIINGPNLLFTAFLEKEFHFKELSLVQISRELVLLFSTLVLLSLGYGLTGIVIGKILAVITVTGATSWLAYRNNLLHLRFRFNINEIRPFLKFGLFVSSKQVLTQLTHHIDELIIGYFLSPEVLGLYHFAKNMLGRLRTIVTTSFSKVLFPTLSKVSNDRARLTRVYSNITRYIAIFAFPIFIGISITAHMFVPLFFGSEWIGSVPFFQILALSYVPYLLTANLSTSLLYSIGKPNLVLYTDILINLAYIFVLFVISWLGQGIIAVALLYALYIVVKTGTLQFLTSYHLHTTFNSYLKLFKYIIPISFTMVLAVLGTQFFLDLFVNDWIEFIFSIFIGGLTYTLGLYIFDRETIFDIKKLLLEKK